MGDEVVAGGCGVSGMTGSEGAGLTPTLSTLPTLPLEFLLGSRDGGTTGEPPKGGVLFLLSEGLSELGLGVIVADFLERKVAPSIVIFLALSKKESSTVTKGTDRIVASPELPRESSRPGRFTSSGF